MKRTATAVWNGSGKDGNGNLTTQSTTLNKTQYSYKSRFEEGVGTNPEELIAAAHAGCFTMALSLILEQAGFKAEQMDTKAEITLAKDGDGFSITKSHLTLRAKIPGIDEAKFKELTGMAEKGCPVSKVLKAEITLDAALV